MKKILNFKRNIEGQALVEFSLVLPILIALILGMIEFGWILNGKITLTSAAREGARVAVIYESGEKASGAVQSAVINSSENSSLTNVESKVNFAGDSAIVTVTAKITPIVGLFVKDDIDLTAKAEMRIE